MFIKIDDLNVYYEVEGEGQPIILLHGWGQSVAAFKPVFDYLKTNFKVYNIDFPGFGKSEEPKTIWSVYDYADMLEKFVSQLNIFEPTIFGHSFGGRVGIIYAGRQNTINKLVLVDSAGIKPKRGLDYYARVYTYKLGKRILSLPGLKVYKEQMMANAGSSDYKSASSTMRQIMIKVVNEDLQHLMPKIKASTLLVWGDADDATPIGDAKIMEKLIPEAGLVVFEGAGHYSYLDRLPQFLRVIDVFLAEERGE
ncbi:MAG: alpha/beta fold hydrolase [Turicibacter sp.]